MTSEVDLRGHEHTLAMGACARQRRLSISNKAKRASDLFIGMQ